MTGLDIIAVATAGACLFGAGVCLGAYIVSSVLSRVLDEDFTIEEMKEE